MLASHSTVYSPGESLPATRISTSRPRRSKILRDAASFVPAGTASVIFVVGLNGFGKFCKREISLERHSGDASGREGGSVGRCWFGSLIPGSKKETPAGNWSGFHGKCDKLNHMLSGGLQSSVSSSFPVDFSSSFAPSSGVDLLPVPEAASMMLNSTDRVRG